jgi:formylglycine-generating enzyme required for sulfatase activity
MGLAATCGPDGNADCCASPTIPRGSFYRSYDIGSDGLFPDMSNPATVSAFRLDKYEVTVARFRQFVNASMGTQQTAPTAGAGAHPNLGGSGWYSAWKTGLPMASADLVADLHCSPSQQTWTDAPGNNENLPINCIDWYEAFAFCIWDGGYLPTEAEWNYAAAGGVQQRAFPWSIPASSLTIDCTYANYEEGGGVTCVNGALMNHVGTESPQGDSRWGQADLAGNVGEWVLDAAGTYQNPCDDCADLSDPGRRYRGGLAWTDASTLRSASRASLAENTHTPALGVRCARDP